MAKGAKSAKLRMICVCVITEQDLNIGEFESKLLNRFRNGRHVPFVGAIENIPLARDHEKPTEGPGPHIVNIANDLVRRELRRLILRRSHVALENRPGGERAPGNIDDWVIGSLLLSLLGLAQSCTGTEDEPRAEIAHQMQPELMHHESNPANR